VIECVTLCTHLSMDSTQNYSRINAVILTKDNGSCLCQQDVFYVDTNATSNSTCIFQDVQIHLQIFNSFDQIWDDTNSGADVPSSVWRTRAAQTGFYNLGDVFIAGRRTKPEYGYLLKVQTHSKDIILKDPQSYDPIWTDGGSGAHQDLSIWKINCPPGYKGLGNVFTNSGTVPPQSGEIYCLKENYVQEGAMSDWEYVWNDEGTNAHAVVTIYRAGNDSSYFTANGSGAVSSRTSRPDWNPQFLIKGRVLLKNDG